MVVVFIPAHNEEECIERAIRETVELYGRGSRGFVLKILVVDDGSTDRTADLARKAGGTEVISHPRNLGLGAATRTAMDRAFEMGAAAAVKLDADLQHDPGDIEKVVRPILDDRADIVWGSRFTGKIHYRMPLLRKWGNFFFTFLMNHLTDYSISDAQTGLMAYSRRYLSLFELPGNYNPPQQLLIDAYNKHMRYMEVPVTFHPRRTGRSFVSLRYLPVVLLSMARVMIYANPLKMFSIIGLACIFSAFTAYGLCVLFPLQVKGIFPNMFALTLFITGVQSLFFGILADLILKKK